MGLTEKGEKFLEILKKGMQEDGERYKQEELLREERKIQEIENYKEGQINWLDNPFFDDWDKVVGHMKNLWGHKKEFEKDSVWKKFFIAHTKDQIRGKPLLIQNTKVRLPLIRQAVKLEPLINPFGKKVGVVELQSFYLIGERFDKRHDGFQKDSLALDFYKYRVQTPDDKEVYVFSQEKLSSETCLLHGMLVELDDYSEMSRTMKLPSLSRIFFCKSFEPAVQTLSPEKLIELTRNINEEQWLQHLVTHPFGTLNNFPLESEILHSAQMLCGKFDGYPLHVCYFGPQGTRKTMGKGETTESKFGDEKIIVDAGNVRIKGLTPSYKGTITKPGYLSEQDRIGIVDELGKMIESEAQKHERVGSNLMGETNSILEHKERVVASGNTDSACMKPTAKFIFISNPVGSRRLIENHVGLIDPTTMSRILWWVQDSEEQNFVLGPEGILRSSPLDIDKTPKSSPETSTSIYTWSSVVENRKEDILLKKSWGEYVCRDVFLTIFDSCYSFNSKIDFSKIQSLVDMTSNLAKEPMKGIWKPRAFHHIFLLVDGICKQRCLFRNHDPSFEAKQEDYALAERILVRMVKAWETNLQPKEEFR